MDPASFRLRIEKKNTLNYNSHLNFTIIPPVLFLSLPDTIHPDKKCVFLMDHMN